MARQSSRGNNTARASRVPGVARDDSDDELGDQDLPWEWVYETPRRDSRDPANAPVAKRLRTQSHSIIGARLGAFECRVGDCILLKADGSNVAWVAIVCEFIEDDDGEMAANFMWFSTEKEIRNKDKKRTDFLWNELYISPSWDINPLASINGKAAVMSPSAFYERYPAGRVPRSSPDYGKIFVCRRGCNTRTATYTDEFVWEDLYQCTPEGIFGLVDFVKEHTQASKRRRSAREPSPEQAFNPAARAGEGTGTTPQNPLSRPAITPQSRKVRRVTTPSSKRVMVKKTLDFTPLGTRTLSPSRLYSSPFQLARAQLHVASVPATLPCREAEFMKVYEPLETAIADGTGSCIYISGTPGTGKTATVREVISRLVEAVESDQLDDFIFVEINGMKVTDPHQAYSLLWEALRGERVSPSQALELLEREFNNPSPRRVPCVVLMDELDQLVTKNQSVMYNFFNWPGQSHSRLIVLAVANTMDLPERTLSNKISSRLGYTRIAFPGYNHEQLIKIIHSRLEGIHDKIVEPDAIQFASRKVAAVSGDARRALDICRRAVELAEAEHHDGAGDTQQLPRVSIATIKRAISEATTNPVQQHLRSLPFTSKLLLAALLARIRRTGLAETTFGDVGDEIFRAAATAWGNLSSELTTSLGRAEDGASHVGCLLGTSNAALELAESGIVLLERHRAERRSKLRLAIGDDEVKMALREDADIKALGLVV